MPIFENFRRPSGQKSRANLKDKYKSDEAREETTERKTWPIEEKLPDPIRRVTPSAPPRQRASDGNVTGIQALSDTMMRVSPLGPLGPRELPSHNNGERAPYEPKYFPRSDSLGSLNSSPTKPAGSLQGARSMSQASHRSGNTVYSHTQSERNVPTVGSFEHPQRRDSIVPQLRRGQSNIEDESILNMRMSQAYNIIKNPRAIPTVPRKNSGYTQGGRTEGASSLGRYPSTPRKARQRSKLDQETSVDNENNAAQQEQQGGISRWGTYGAQDSPKMPLTPNRSVSNGAEMQQWLQQNATILKKSRSPERTRNRGQYDHLSPRHKNEAEAFQKFKEQSHRRKVSIEAIRKAQEAMIIYPNNSVKTKYGARRNDRRSPSTVRKASAGWGLMGEQSPDPLPERRLPEVQYPLEEMPSPFLSPEEKLERAGYKPSTQRKPVYGGRALQYPEKEQVLESPEAIQNKKGRSRIPTPNKVIRRKTVKGPSMSNLAAKRAKEYEQIASGNPYENRSGQSTPSFGLVRSYPENHLAIRAIATATWEEVDSEPFKFPELVPKPLNIVKKRASKDSGKSTIRNVLVRKPTLRTSKTQGPGSSAGDSIRGYWKQSRTRSDDFETLKDRQDQEFVMKRMQDEIDDYLDILLANRVEAKLVEEERERDYEIRVASRSTNSRELYFDEQSDHESDHHDQLYRASMAAERNRREELSAEELLSSPKAKESDMGPPMEASRAVISGNELSQEKQEAVVAKVNDKWAEMRAKLRVDSTYSDLSMLARSPVAYDETFE